MGDAKNCFDGLAMRLKPSFNNSASELNEKKIKKLVLLLGGEDITLGTPQLFWQWSNIFKKMAVDTRWVYLVKFSLF